MDNRSLNIKILAVDDNQDNLISLKALLKDIFPKASVFTALTGEKGLELASAVDPDVILLDILMPGMDGFEVCRRLKANVELREIPVVFVTAIKGDNESSILALESGAEAFITKPIDESELTTLIRAMRKIKTANIQNYNEKERLAELVEEKTFELRKAHLTTLNLLEDLKRENEARKIQEENLKYMSFHDHLTKLYNRRYLDEALIKLDTDRNLPISIVVGDVNGLKLVNDSFGHAMGDKLLKEVANVIKKECRADDIIARLGGDEFIILLPRTDAYETEQIIKGIKKRSTNHKAGAIDISISFGYEIKKTKEENIQEVLIKAEDSMYRYKLYESKSLRSKTIDVIMNALIEKSNRELLHSKRVSSICEMIAIELNFKKAYINQIRMAGLVHDIGKIGISESILNKPQKLDMDEWEAIRKHPEAGWRILHSVNEFSELAEFVLSHHERWDGKGYPRGLKGDEIAIEARIIAIADSYDAMTSDRSYRKGISEDEAIDELRRCSGTQFDPHMVKLFTKKVLGKE
ncbi:MAG: diguanylate cyclase [Bacillota bacterium]|nr:diguanylate cyclase [Bacillota bacterium]